MDSRSPIRSLGDRLLGNDTHGKSEARPAGCAALSRPTSYELIESENQSSLTPLILGDMEVAVEAKASTRVTSDHMKGLRTLVVDHPRVRRRIVVCLEPRARRTADGIDILPWRRFAEELWSDALD